MGEIQLRRLRCFVAVAQELHFGRAAHLLNMAQPPLSQQIQRLEAELGVELFRRYPRRIELTNAGKLLLAQAPELLSHAERLESSMRSAARGSAGPLSVGFTRSAGYALLPTVLRAFHERYPEVRLAVQEHTTPAQNTALQSGHLDVGIVRQHLSDAEITLEPLAGERVIAALPDTHPLCAAPELTMDLLARESFAFMRRAVSPAYYALLLSACAAAGFTPKIAQEAPDPASLIGLISAGLFVALVPQSAATPHPQVVYRRVEDLEITVDFLLAFRTGENDLLVEHFREVAHQVTSECAARRRLPGESSLDLLAPSV